jgi:transcriptional repressor NrdR
MRCPFCHTDNDRVIDSRAGEEGYVIRRRRECMSCKKRFTTFERLEGATVKVIKKNDNREPFEVDKIRRGLRKACWKRPVSDESIEKIITTVESAVYTEYEAEIDSRELGELVMEQLAQLDPVAYVRFASVYREFKDVSDFVAELRPMLLKGHPQNVNPPPST